jgi:hypothetical protein
VFVCWYNHNSKVWGPKSKYRDPEELNPGSLIERIERQQKLDISIGKLSTEIESLKEALSAGSSTRAASQQTFDSAISDMQKPIDTLQSSITSRIDQLRGGKPSCF